MAPPPHSLLSSLWNLRHLPAVAADPLAFFTRTAQEQGGVAAFDFGPRRQWLISDPDAIRTVFIKHHDHLGKDQATLCLSPILGSGLITNEGEDWRSRRKLVAPSFRPKHFRHYADHIVDATDKQPLVDGVLGAHETMIGLLKEIMLRTLFGTMDQATEDIADAVTTSLGLIEADFMSAKRFLPRFVPTHSRRFAAQSRQLIADRLAPMIAERRGDTEHLDLLARLVAARDPDGQPMSDAQLVEEVTTLFFAGFETSANSLAFAIALLARHPEVQEHLAHERAEVLGDRVPTASDARLLVRHNAVMDEAMRLFPPVWGLGRRVLEPIDVQGHRLEAGHQINASPWVLHRNPDWHDEPHAFRPERFWNSAKKRESMAFIPFGVGPRVCVGQHFSRMQTALVLARWLQRRRVHTVDDTPLVARVNIALKPACGAPVEVEALA